MPLPRAVSRINEVVTNRVAGVVAGRRPTAKETGSACSRLETPRFAREDGRITLRTRVSSTTRCASNLPLPVKGILDVLNVDDVLLVDDSAGGSPATSG
jgi:hypothetical protein